MKRSTIVITIIIAISILAGGVLGFYFYINSSSVTRNALGPQTIETGGGFGSPSVNTSVTLPGNASTTQEEQEPEISPATTTIPAEETPILRQIYSNPVAGFAFFNEDIIATTSAVTETVVLANGTTSTTSTKVIKPATSRIIGQKEVLYLVDRGNGHIFKTSSSTKEIEKVSNTTIPKIYEAYFIDKDNFIIRGLYGDSDIIQTKFATIKTLSATSTELSVTTKNLSSGISQIALSPNLKRMFYVKNGNPTGFISNPDESNLVTALRSNFTEWNIAWPNENLITINTKPSGTIAGYLYALNPKNYDLEKIIGGVNGLTSITSPTGNKVVYSESRSGMPNLFIFDRQSGKKINLFFRTLADKCVWSVKEKEFVYCAVPQDIAFGNYPDVWYQGQIFFSDNVWKINAVTGETKLIARLNSLSNKDLDVINPTLSKNEDFFVFNAKKDLSLWGLKLIKPESATSTPKK